MAPKNIILMNLIIYVVLIYGVVGEANVSLEKASPEQLKSKHKQPVKTVLTKHGDVYDCIDFFEQPAFDHPLLKNHDYHFDMKPSSVPNEIPDNGKDKMKDRLKPKRVGCPRGKVPIRRTRRDSFIPEKTSHLNSQTVTYYAGTSTKDGIGKIYGASAFMVIANPRVYDANQYSSSIISIGDGNEFLHVGWTVHPQLYGDYNTRFYIWTHVATASCYNTKCPGFVIVNTNYPLDMILMNANYSGGDRIERRFFIYQERENGNWWLMGDNNEQIGFWPKNLFSTLSNGANKVYYGGVVAVSPGDTRFAQMGFGNRPENENTDGNGVCRHISIVNQDGNEEYAASKSDILESLNERYVARNIDMNWYSRRKYWDSTILFGGY